jgi:SpoVK/Ycf46/Vps4 family AAA+-type ATPase
MIEVPFDVLLLFSTNLPPADLADEAFLRRIRYKVEVRDPTTDEFREIFRRECQLHGIATSDDMVTHLLDTWYQGGRAMRGCHGRDLVEAVLDLSRATSGAKPAMTKAVLDEACRSYFL